MVRDELRTQHLQLRPGRVVADPRYQQRRRRIGGEFAHPLGRRMGEVRRRASVSCGE
jgi:hypothetical protein